MEKAGKNKPFRERMDALSGLVEELERGDLDLEAAITRFEAGKKLHQELLQELAAYERRLERLVEGADGEDRLEPIVEDDEEGRAAGPDALG